MTRRLLTSWLCVTCLVATGCHRARPPTKAPQPAAVAGVDDGAAMLADVENARQAIARHALLAAANDVNRGLEEAFQLAGAASSVFPEDTPKPDGAAAPNRMSRFAAHVRLLSAKTELTNGNVAHADRDLAAIETGIPASALPATFPLLRAEESLAVAKTAVDANQASELPVQLAIAQQALQGYAGTSHLAAARALAAEIGQALAQPDATSRIPPARLAEWATRVSGWI